VPENFRHAFYKIDVIHRHYFAACLSYYTHFFGIADHSIHYKGIKVNARRKLCIVKVSLMGAFGFFTLIYQPNLLAAQVGYGDGYRGRMIQLISDLGMARKWVGDVLQ
jgi:hypothetical protein